MGRIALYFGSFNPIHRGHSHIAQTIVHKKLADSLWWVPSPQSPFKSAPNLMPFTDRLAMIKLVTEKLGEPFEVCDVERHLPKPNYTLTTLETLGKKHPQHDFSLLIGEDNAVELPQWKGFSELNERYSFIIFPRPGYSSANSSTFKKAVILDEAIISVSSTQVRKWLKTPMKEQKNLMYWLEKDVWNYILTQKLYLSDS